MIKGKVTALRAIEENDLETLLKWRNKPEFRIFFREHRELSMYDQQRWYASISARDSNSRMFAIEQLSDGMIIGACGLCYHDTINRSADLSIYIGYNDLYIDKVFAPDATITLMKYGFEEMNLHRIWAEIYDIDSAKKEFFLSLGFKLDGRFREAHWTQKRWCDSLFFSLLENECDLERYR